MNRQVFAVLSLVTVLAFTASVHRVAPLWPLVASPRVVQAAPSLTVVHKSGTLSDSETWTADNLYWIDSDLTVPVGVVLHVNPGVIVKFGNMARLVVNGTLTAEGSPSARIYFTSIKDDDIGGDTNGDGRVSTPGPGNWGWVECGSTSTVRLDYLTLHYSGYNGYYGDNHGAIYAVGWTIPQLGANLLLTDNWVNGIEVPGGTLSADTYLFPGYPNVAYFLRGDLVIPRGVTLTLAPGAIVKSSTGTRLLINGTLRAIGNRDQRIYLTSMKDDEVGGDTNNDRRGSTPGRSDWGWLEFGEGSASELDYLTLRYSGYNYYHGDNQAALIAGGYTIPRIGDNVLLTNNWMNAIEIPGGTLSADNYTFPNYPPAPYYFRGDLTIPHGVQLSFQPGVVAKLDPGSRLLIFGAVMGLGTEAQRLTFTSVRDDDAGGDTNADGRATSPAPGNWGWFELQEAGSLTLDYVTLRYGGYNYYHGDNHGVVSLAGRSASLSHLILSNNTIALEAYVPGIVIHESQIVGNQYGVRNDVSGVWLDARRNWWGDPTGPRDTGTADGRNNPSGRGDAVSDWVLYDDWFTSPGGSTPVETRTPTPTASPTAVPTTTPGPMTPRAFLPSLERGVLRMVGVDTPVAPPPPVVEASPSPTPTSSSTATLPPLATRTPTATPTVTPSPTPTTASLEVVGRLGGSMIAVLVRGNTAYVGVGPEFTVLDVSDRTRPQAVGRLLLPDRVVGMDVVGTYAYVAARSAGLRVIDISNPTAPREVGMYDTPDDAEGVFIASGYAYVAAGSSGLQVVDIANPSRPRAVASLDTPGYSYRVSAVSGLAFVADGPGGLRIINVGNPAAPHEVGHYDCSGQVYDVQVVGRFAYVAAYGNGLRILDVMDPTTPQEVGVALDRVAGASGVFVSGSTAFVAMNWGGLRLVDVSNPAQPHVTGVLNPRSMYPWSVVVSGGYAYLADRFGGIWVVDVSHPDAPREVGHYDKLGYPFNVVVRGSQAYVPAGGGGLRVIDVSNPAIPRDVGGFSTSGWALGVAVRGNYAYLSDDIFGLKILDITGASTPYQVGSFTAPGGLGNPNLVGHYVYMTETEWWDGYTMQGGGLRVLDITDPTTPRSVVFLDTPEEPEGLAVADGYAYTIAPYADLYVYDIGNPAAPRAVAHYPIPGYARSVAASGQYVYVAADTAGVRIIDVADPSNPREVGVYTTIGTAQGVFLLGNLLYLAEAGRWVGQQYVGGGLTILDVANPVTPRLLTSTTATGPIYSIAVQNGYAYVTGAEDGLKIVRLQ